MASDKQLPAPLVTHECDQCGYVYLDDCQRVDLDDDDIQPPARVVPMDYAQAVVVAAAGISVSISLYHVVDQSFLLLQHGQLLPFDFNAVVTCVCTTLGLIGGYAWAKKKGEEQDGN